MKRTILLLTALLIFGNSFSQMFFFNYNDPNQITTIEEDGDYFWAGTNGGLYKWFKSGAGLIGKYHILNGLPSNFVHYVKKDHFYNELWVGTNEGIAVMDVLNNWTVYNTSDGLPNNVVKSIAIDLSGNKWLGTNNGLTKYDPVHNTWTTYTTADGLVADYVNAVDVDFQGNVWIGTDLGVSKFDGENWTTFTQANGLVANKITAIATDDTRADVWFGTNFGISKFDGNDWLIYTTDSGLITNSVNSIAIDAQSTVWIGTKFGVSEFDGENNWTDHNWQVDQLGSDLVYVVNVDAEGNKWFGHDAGVSRLSHNGSDWSNYFTGEGIVDNEVNAIAGDSKNHIWFGTNEGLSEFDGKHWKTHLDKKNVYSIKVTENDAKWIGTQTGLYYLTDTTLMLFNTDSGMISEEIVAIDIDVDGRKWCASDSGVMVFNDTSWLIYNADSGLASNYAEDVVIDQNNNKWFATKAGVSFYNDTTWTTYTETDGLANDEVHAIAIDHEQNLWFGTEEGLSKFDGNNWTNFFTSDGLKDDFIQDINFDAFGNVWVATGNGISVFNENFWQNYTMDEGLALNNVPAIYLDMNNSLWAGTSGGVSKGTCQLPELDFLADTVCLPGISIFTNHSSNIDRATKYSWDINNNDTIDHVTKDISHHFVNPGIYQVQLIADNFGCLDSLTKNVVARITPDVSLINNNPLKICDGKYVSLEAQINNAYDGAVYKYSWSNGANTAIIEAGTDGAYVLEVMDGNCFGEKDTAEVSVVQPYSQSQLCMVTVDENTGKNLVVWDHIEGKGIESYNIYKLIGNQYSIIGNVLHTEVPVFEDFNSNPDVKAARYAITTLDTCGNESDFSPYHQTIHLGVARGIPITTAVLDWTEYIDESGSYDPVWYYIYKGTSESDLAIYDSVNSIIGTEYNDPNANGIFFYQVSVDKPEVCDPANLLKANNGPFSRSLSNLEDNRLQGTVISSFNRSGARYNIYPNPVSDYLFIESPTGSIINSVSILSSDGKSLFSDEVNANSTEMNVGYLLPGLYILIINDGENAFSRKLLVK